MTLIEKVRGIAQKVVEQFQLDWVSFEVQDTYSDIDGELYLNREPCVLIIKPYVHDYGYQQKISDKSDVELEMQVYLEFLFTIRMGLVRPNEQTD